ncbi:BsuPI-related putative proteinase inhibitor [Shewanella fidelis]|uniref:BsuPI-related putative proteinase inhibitor n=1 Tax=Shewanella fidelis TaxID=173509 RepID=UPI00048D2907|nr:BsuPI-related putative proteinase inhibitor [Shewanella fidelis]
MLAKALFPIIGLSVIGCSGQQVSETITEPATLQPAKVAQQSQPQQTVKPILQPVVVAGSDKVHISESLDNRAKTKDSAMQPALFDAELLVSDKANVTLQYTNVQSYGVPLMFRSGMTADLWLFDPQANKVWAWSNEMMFTQAIRETVMPAGKTQKVRFKIPIDVAAKIGKGYRLEAIFAGNATESQRPAMSKVIYTY